MSKPLSELKDKYIGKDVWIVLVQILYTSFDVLSSIPK